VIVFAEGLCIQERRLRPLKKGVSRMIFGSYEYLGENNNLTVVPVGINYSKADKFGSSAFYNIGDPILVKDFIEEYKLNPAKANNSFLKVLYPKMKELITHINNPENDAVVYHAEELFKKDLLVEQGLNYKDLSHDFIVLTQLTEKVNSAEIEKPELLAEFKLQAAAYFKVLNENNLRDWLIAPKNKNKITYPSLILRILFLILLSPVHLTALIGNYLPYKLTDMLARKIVKNKEFYSSFAIAFGMTFFLINYILWFTIIYHFSETIFPPLFICFVLIMSGWFGLYYSPFKKKTFGIFRLLKNKELGVELFEKRKEIVSLFNKF
jgi:hypothetical protein